MQTYIPSNGKTVKPGITIDVHVPSFGFSIGETHYIVCDSVGLVLDTVCENKLEQFLE